MEKSSLRTIYKTKRAALSASQIEDMSLAIANNSLQLAVWDRLYFHIFLTISEKKEVDTQFLMHILQGRDKSIVLSKSNFEELSMRHYLLQENTKLKPSVYGIPEPIDGIEIPVNNIEVVFIPLVAFDLAGNRIGYGKGFYDRFLEKCSEDTIFVGLSFFEPEESIAANSFDIQLHYCVTPSQVYRFNT